MLYMQLQRCCLYISLAVCPLLVDQGQDQLTSAACPGSALCLPLFSCTDMHQHCCAQASAAPLPAARHSCRRCWPLQQGRLLSGPPLHCPCGCCRQAPAAHRTCASSGTSMTGSGCCRAWLPDHKLITYWLLGTCRPVVAPMPHVQEQCVVAGPTKACMAHTLSNTGARCGTYPACLRCLPDVVLPIRGQPLRFKLAPDHTVHRRWRPRLRALLQQLGAGPPVPQRHGVAVV